MAETTITTLGDLQRSAVQYRRELLMMPVTTAAATLRHMRGLSGTRGRRVLGQLGGDVELGPWDPKRKAEGGFTITPRTLETYLGNMTHDFVPNDVWDTVYGSLDVQGDALLSTDIARYILFFVAGQLGKKLNMALWSGKRNASGKTTADLFDGFDTITAAEVAAGSLSAEAGNFMEVDAIDQTNAVDVLKSIYRNASDELRGVKTKMFITYDQYAAYCDDYKLTTGATPYNTQYEKTLLEGSAGLCELVPLASKKGSEFIHLTPGSNMVYGYGRGVAGETVAVAKYSSWVLTLEAAMFFGVQFESISPEVLMAARTAAAEP